MPERALLLTGFGPFPGVVDNPTARLALAFAGRQLGAWRVHTDVLPAAWQRARAQVQARAAALNPEILVHLGVASETVALRLEVQAANALQFRVADADGAQPLEGAVVAGAPAVLQTALDVPSLVAVLQRAGLPAEVSHDAGRYVCNATYFNSLHAYGDRPVLFVHVPPVSAAWPLARLELAVGQVLDWLVA